MSVFKKISRYIYVAVAIFVIFCGFYNVIDHNKKHFSPVFSENEEEVVLPIIMYHGLSENKSRQGKYVLSPELFESDLEFLTKNGYETVVVKDLIDHFEKGTPLPEKPIMLTFDDGFYNNYVYAFPLLKKYNKKAVISVIGYLSERDSKEEKLSPNYSYLPWNLISEMNESGLVEIQNHSYNMHSLSGRNGSKRRKNESFEEYEKALSCDLSTLQKLLKENCNITPTAFCYPYGAVSDDSVKIVKSLGFKASFTCFSRINVIKNEDGLFLLNRYLRTSEESEKFFDFINTERESAINERKNSEKP